MIEKFRVLQDVKYRREDACLRALQTARAMLSNAIQLRQEQATAVAESAVTLTDRENAIYQRIMQKVVATGEIELSKERVLLVYKGHQQLEDDLELASQRCAVLAKDVEDARHVYQ
ncbi:hypothetical protein PDO_5008, partial [Rhizobium sp. PDO1-076]|uniref:type III secretion system stalk subunit SctO n=1 Tax=Rhizobium sp. PDO1-076 TaxID=1125979 RepID=UPI00024E25A2